MVVRGLADVKGAKERLEECQPSNEYLFRADLGELAKAIRNEAQFKGKNFSRKRSFFQKKNLYEGDKGRGKSDRGKGSSSKSSFSKGKKAFRKKN